ncbi:MAG TPA: hypothetical protein VKV21_17190 [Solirubrobacteraceae bacterium]|nr:hypothetical protein [Solirubrobacteraceae bacterium]
MPTYLLSFRMPSDYTPTPDTRARWREFFDAISPHLEELGNPVFSRRSVGETAAGTVLGGYSLISADSLEQAAELAAGCPLIARGGGVDVGELAPIPVASEA